MPESISHWLSYAAQKIKSDSPLFDAELLLCHHLRKNRAYLHAFPEQPMADDLLKKLATPLQRLSTGYPLAYLIGTKDFWDMRLKINAHTLIPRPDTETLIETCKTLLPPSFSGDMLELGTGSGAIAIALSRVFPQATITATDNSKKALLVAQENANHWQKSQIAFVYADWFVALDAPTPPQAQPLDNTFDIIISNPPYIAKDDPHLPKLKYEPISALVAESSGLGEIKKIIAASSDKLKANGYLLLEHGYQQGPSVHHIFQSTPHWKHINTIRDLGNQERVTLAQKRTD